MAFIALALTRRLSFTESLTLCTEVIAQHRTQDEVLLGSQFVERTGDDEANGVETFLAPDIEVQVVLARRLKHKVHVLTAKPFGGTGFILFRTGEQHHLAHPLLEFVDVVRKHLQF